MVGLTKALRQAISQLHNGHELEKLFFFNFGHFHGRQPFRPILRPTQKVYRPPTFFQFFLPKSLAPYIRSNICEIKDSDFPYFGEMQFSSFLPFWLFGGQNSLKGQVRSVPYPKIALKWFNQVSRRKILHDPYLGWPYRGSNFQRKQLYLLQIPKNGVKLENWISQKYGKSGSWILYMFDLIHSTKDSDKKNSKKVTGRQTFGLGCKIGRNGCRA